MKRTTHQGIREAIRARIISGEWKLGERIPGEVALAEEYGCSRTTVNRALQTLAQEGMVERKRKGGTRVRPLPTSQAQFRIPIMREQVESRGHRYSHRIESREVRVPPMAIRKQLELPDNDPAAYVESLHLADGKPFAFEKRWVNLGSVPAFSDADLSHESANEWLVRHVPFSRGEVRLSASAANAKQARLLGTDKGAPLFTMHRLTWFEERTITAIELSFAPGYEITFGV
ncbi:GntR family transcriptional regulator [Aurantiacibacter sp. D1-12]|uniref:GntR family transcriptional regulator n=1 Tax=Aurantiacibacter sp. D1-12 TaxID=2993658 RepID=UPI00237D0172|nr:UTRA domain-containing protein [Aurantiacibacter sp. D1-12]MDE1467757.1 UTRA domain-containing protein [Aurantiacibacter sp. D1-12]